MVQMKEEVQSALQFPVDVNVGREFESKADLEWSSQENPEDYTPYGGKRKAKTKTKTKTHKLTKKHKRKSVKARRRHSTRHHRS